MATNHIHTSKFAIPDTFLFKVLGELTFHYIYFYVMKKMQKFYQKDSGKSWRKALGSILSSIL